jgi:hypothetical protein
VLGIIKFACITAGDIEYNEHTQRLNLSLTVDV